MRILVLAAVVALCAGNPVIYRISEPGEVADTEGRWIPTGGQPRPKFISDAPPQRTNILEHGRGGHSCLQHQGYAGQPGIVPGQPVPGGYGIPPNYPVYPLVYYYQYPSGVVSQQQQQPEQQQQLKPQAPDQYPKQAGFYQIGTTPKPPSGGAPPGSIPVSGGAWQQYICSVFPYLSSCSGQQQGQPQHPQPSGLGYPGYSYPSYGGYPGYQQMAQFPVYYIVQTEARPPPNIVLPPGTVGIIRITGHTPVSLKPEEEITKEEVKPVDTEIIQAAVKTEAEAEKRPEQEVSQEKDVPKEGGTQSTKE